MSTAKMKIPAAFKARLANKKGEAPLKRIPLRFDIKKEHGPFVLFLSSGWISPLTLSRLPKSLDTLLRDLHVSSAALEIAVDRSDLALRHLK